MSRNKKDLNDITAALFSVGFLLLAAEKTKNKNGEAVTSLRSFLFRDDFTYLCGKHLFVVTRATIIFFRQMTLA